MLISTQLEILIIIELIKAVCSVISSKVLLALILIIIYLCLIPLRYWSVVVLIELSSAWCINSLLILQALNSNVYLTLVIVIVCLWLDLINALHDFFVLLTFLFKRSLQIWFFFISSFLLFPLVSHFLKHLASVFFVVDWTKRCIDSSSTCLSCSFREKWLLQYTSIVFVQYRRNFVVSALDFNVLLVVAQFVLVSILTIKDV